MTEPRAGTDGTGPARARAAAAVLLLLLLAVLFFPGAFSGGSFYYLRHQDLLMGSERVRIEMRDKASGIVTGVVNLAPSADYDIDYTNAIDGS